MHKCMICSKEYETLRERDKCVESHDIVYIPLTREELNRLTNFIMIGERQLLTEELVKKLFKFAHKGNNG